MAEYETNQLRRELTEAQDRFIETFDARLRRVESFLAIYGLQGAAAIMLQPIEAGKQPDPELAQAAQTVITAAQGVMQRALEAAATDQPLADDTGDKGEGYLPITGTPTAKVTDVPAAPDTPTATTGLFFDQVNTAEPSDSPPAQGQEPAQP